MIHPIVINFFKEHNLYNEEMFEYLSKNTIHYDYRVVEDRIFTGCGPCVDKKNGILTKVFVTVPFVIDDITMLINIHEYTHAIEYYSKIGKKFKKDEYVEVLPMMFELIYIREHYSKELLDYENFLNNCISRNNIEYIIGTKMQTKLADTYNYENLTQLKRKVKKIGRKIK